MTSTLFLDADGVIQQTPSDWLRQVERLCPDPASRASFTQVLFREERACLLGRSDFSETLARIMAQWSSSISPTKAIQLWAQVEPWQAGLEKVQAVRHAGTQVVLVSNQHEFRARHMRSDLAYEHLFDHLFFSCELGVAKPDASFFDAVLQTLDLDPAQAHVIDDQADNVAAAQAMGLGASCFHISQGVETFERILQGIR